MDESTGAVVARTLDAALLEGQLKQCPAKGIISRISPRIPSDTPLSSSRRTTPRTLANDRGAEFFSPEALKLPVLPVLLISLAVTQIAAALPGLPARFTWACLGSIDGRPAPGGLPAKEPHRAAPSVPGNEVQKAGA